MNTFVFQPGATWRKVAFTLLSDSCAYREVMDANPAWDITKIPAPGSVLNRPNSSGSPSATLTQTDITTNTNISGIQQNSDFFPFDSENEYLASLARYSSSSLLSPNRYNGFTFSDQMRRI